MNQPADLGASGRTGRLVVDLARSRRLGVRALVRLDAHFDERSGVKALCSPVEEARDVAATLLGTVAVT